MTTSRILVAILVYNTAPKVGRLCDGIRAFMAQQKDYPAHDIHVTIFDDASSDNSAAGLRENLTGLCALETLDINQGYGGLVKHIFDYARLHGYDYLCIFPGDLQRRFEDIPRLIAAITDNDLDVVAGSKDPSRVEGRMPPTRKYGNILLKYLTRLWSEKITDPLAGFKCYRVFPCYKIVWLCQSRFGFDLDFSFWSTYLQLKKGEVPCTVSYDDHTSTIRSTTWQGLRFVLRSLLLAFILQPALRLLQYTTTKR